MGKNHEKYTYYDVAVPRTNVLLLDYIEEMHANTNIPEGQLLVQFATEYVKQFAGQSNPLAVLGPLQAVMASMFSAMPQQAVGSSTNGAAAVTQAESLRAVQPLRYDLTQSGAAPDDMENAFGEPD